MGGETLGGRAVPSRVGATVRTVTMATRCRCAVCGKNELHYHSSHVPGSKKFKKGETDRQTDK